MTARSLYLRLAGSLLALAAGGAGVVVVIILLRGEPGPVSSNTTIAAAPAQAPAPEVAGGRVATPTQPGFPSPPPGAIVLGREAGSDALGLALVPGRTDDLVRVSVVSAAGPGAAGLQVSVAFGA